MFRRNPRFIEELKAEPGVRDELRSKASGVAGAAAGITPHAPGSFTVSDDGQTISVGSDDPFMHLVEWGSVNNSPYAPLRRAVRAEGLRLEETNAP